MEAPAEAKGKIGVLTWKHWKDPACGAECANLDLPIHHHPLLLPPPGRSEAVTSEH